MDDIWETLPKQIVHVLNDYLERSSTSKRELANEIVKLTNAYYPKKNQSPENGVNYVDERARMAYIYEFLQYGVAIFRCGFQKFNSDHIKKFIPLD